MNKKLYSDLHGAVVIFASYLLIYSVFANGVVNTDTKQSNLEELKKAVDGVKANVHD